MGQAFITRRGGGGYSEGDIIGLDKLRPNPATEHSGGLVPRYTEAEITSNISINKNGTIFGLCTVYNAYSSTYTKFNIIRIKYGCKPEVKDVLSNSSFTSVPSLYNYVCSDDNDDDIIYINTNNRQVSKVNFSTMHIIWSISQAQLMNGIPYNSDGIICWVNTRSDGKTAYFLNTSTKVLKNYSFSSAGVGACQAHTSCLDKNGAFYLWTGDSTSSSYRSLRKIDPNTASLVWQKTIDIAAGTNSSLSAWDELVVSQNHDDDANNTTISRYSLDGEVIGSQTNANYAYLLFKTPSSFENCKYIGWNMPYIYSTLWDSWTESSYRIGYDIGSVRDYAEISYNIANPMFVITNQPFGSKSSLIWDMPYNGYQIIE